MMYPTNAQALGEARLADFHRQAQRAARARAARRTRRHQRGQRAPRLLASLTGRAHRSWPARESS
jgi:hypothetical protein